VSDTSPPRFSVSQFTTWHQSFEQDVRLYQRLGIDGIEICERKLSRDRHRAMEQLAMVRDSSLRVTSVQPRVHALFQDFMCPDLLDPRQRMSQFHDSIDLIADAFPGQNIPLVTITGNAPDMNFHQGHMTARRLYPEVADHAGERGLRIMFEPLHPILMNSDTFICTLDASMRLIRDVGRPNFGLMFDIWHLWHEPDIEHRTAAVGDRLFGVHLSDWPNGEPRCSGDRRICGQGIIDLPALLNAFVAAGYDGAYCLEIFSADHLPDSLWKRDAADVIAQNRAGFEAAWQENRNDALRR